MRKKTETRKKFGKICALAVVGMFVAMTSMSVPADDPDDWTIGGDRFGGGTTPILGTLTPDDLSIVAGGNQGIILNGHVDPIFVGIGLPPGELPRCPLEVGGGMTVAGNMAVGEGFAMVFPAPPNGTIIEGWVGIGTPVPMEALDVEGNIHASGSLISGNSITIDGTNDKITASSGTINFDNENLVTTGNVGIGTTSPTQELHVAGNARITGALYDSNNDPGTSGQVLMTTGIGIHWVDFTFAPDGDWDYTTSPPHMFSLPTGNVGIGTMNPINKLDVAGGMAVGEGFAGQFPAPPNGMIIEGWVAIGTPLPTEIPYNELYGSGMIVEGFVGIGTPEPSCALEVVGDVWLNSDTIKMGDGTFYNKVQKDAKLSTGNYRIIIDENDDQTDRYFSVEKDEGKNDPQGTGTELMRCQENGNVGIGTTSPTQKLHVNGSVRIENAIYDNNNDPGTSGQILQTTGSGIDWVDPPSTSDGDWTISGNDMYSAVSGNVGIGTASPTYKLEVKNGNARIWDWLYVGDAFQGKGIRFCDDPIISSAFNYMNIYLNTDDLQPWEGSFSIWKGKTAVKQLHFEFGSGDSYILPASDFGIGTTNPSSKLDVNGDIEIGSGNAFYFGDPNTDGTWRITRSGNSLVFQRRESGNWVTKSTMT